MNAVRSASRKSVSAVRLSALALAVKIACGTAAYADLPTGGNVIAGAGSIAQSGNTLTVTQQTTRMGVEWESFNVGAGQRVQFVQPDANSVALNRVVGSDASNIMGSLDANGKVFLVNPNGVVFGKDAQVNTGGLVASTLEISNENFNAGNYRFTKGAKAASIVNSGTLSAGSVVLIAPTIENAGSINTHKGNTTLAAGDAVTVSVMNNGLITAKVDKATLNASIKNSGRIVADGGSISLQAGTADAVLDSLINTEGLLQARSIEERDGKIFLGAGAGGTTLVGGTVDASGYSAGQKGGEITALGKNVGIVEGATLDASGPNGGGTVLIGGNWQGQGAEYDASNASMARTANIKADASHRGDGGKVVLWADDTTTFAGNISARAGVHGGDGGKVETSGKITLNVSGTVDASSPQGDGGLWLLDPTDMTIGTTEAASVRTSLNSGTDVTLSTNSAGSGTGNLTIAAPIAKTSGNNATLTLAAHADVIISAPVTSTSGQLNLVMMSRAAGGAFGRVRIDEAANIATNGGYLHVSGGTGSIAAGTAGNAIGDVAQNAIAVLSTITTGGGDVVMQGGGMDRSDRGLWIGAGAAIHAGGGNVTVRGGSGTGVVSSGTISTTGSGNILLTSSSASQNPGTLSAQAGSITIVAPNSFNWGGSVASITTTTGNIEISGSSSSAGNEGTYISGSKTIRSDSGHITLTGTTNLSGAGRGLLIDGDVSIQTGGSGAVTIVGTGGNHSNAAYRNAIQFGSSGANRAIAISSGTGGVNITGNGNSVALNSLLSFGTAPSIQSTGDITIGGNKAISYLGSATAAGALAISSTSGDLTLGSLGAGGDLRVTGTNVVQLNGVISNNGVGSVLLQAGGNLNVAGSITKTAGADTFVALESAANVNVTGDIGASVGKLSVYLRSRTGNASTGSIYLGGNIATGGGDLFAWGGSGVTAGSGLAQAASGGFGIHVADGRTLDAGGGHLALWAGSAGSGSTALEIGASSILTTHGTGNIELRGTTTNSAWGMYAGNQASIRNDSGTGNILVDATSAGTRGLFINAGTYRAGGTFTATGTANGAGGVGLEFSSGSEPGNLTAQGNLTLTGNGAGGIAFTGEGPFNITSTNGRIALTGNRTTGVGIDLASNVALLGSTAGIKIDTPLTGSGVGLRSSATQGMISSLGAVTITGSNYQYTRPISSSGAVTIDMNNGAVALGNVTSNGALNVLARASTLTVNGTLNANSGNVSLQSSAGMTLSSGASLRGADIYLSHTTGSFINNAGAAVMNATGRWIVYSVDPTANTYGGLASGSKAIWNKRRSSLAPASVASGNRYVFQYSPVAGVLGGTITKTYGETSLLTVPSGTLTAYTNTQGGMWLADTLSDVASSGIGAADLTSDGFAYDANVGVYAVTNGASITSTGYTINIDPATELEVLKRAITVTAQTDTKTYDGTTASVVTPTITTGSLVNGDTVTWSQAFDDRHAGTSKRLTASGTIDDGNGGNNYDVTFIDDITGLISQRAVTGSLIGTAHREYDGTTKIELTDANYALADVIVGDDVALDGSLSGTLDSKHVGTGKNVSVSGLSLYGADAGNYIVNATADANIGEVTQRALTLAAVTDTKIYDRSNNSDGMVTSTGLAGDDTVTATQSFNSSNAGNRTLSVDGGYVIEDGNGGNNYLVTLADAAGTIDRRNVIVTVAADDKVYDGTTIATGTVTGITNMIAGDQIFSDGTASFAFADKNAGSNKAVSASGMTLSGADAANYQIASVGASNAAITPATLIVTAASNSKIYGSADPTLLYGYSGLQGADDVSVFSGSLSRVAGENVGSYNIQSGSISAGSNYTIAYTGNTFEISPRTLAIHANDLSKIYGNVDPSLSFSHDALVNGDTEAVFSGSLKRGMGENVGSYAISRGTLAAGNNYDVVFTGGHLDITPRTLALSANARGKSYGALDPTLSFSHGTLVNGDTDAIFSGALARAVGEDVGSYAISQGTLSAGSNYVIDFTGNAFDISTGLLVVNANARSKIYGDTDPSLTYTFSGLMNDDDASVFTGGLSRVAGENVGHYAIGLGTLDAGSNYEIQFNGADLAITPRDLYVTADALSKVYGSIDPSLTYGFTGLVNGDTAGVFSGALARSAGENVNNYAITQGSLSAGGNYTVHYTGNTFSITPAMLTVAANATTKVYGDIDPTLTYSYSGLLNGDTAGVFSGDLARDVGETVLGGPYTIGQGSLSAGGNYVINYTGNQMIITPKALIVDVANNISKVYDGTTDLPSVYGAYHVSGIVGHDDVNVAGTLAFDSRHAGARSISLTDMSLGGVDAGNYYLPVTSTTGSGEITARAITVSAQSDTKVYDGTTGSNLAALITHGSLAAGDAANWSQSFEDRNAGHKTLSARGQVNDGNDGNNYLVTFEDAMGAIERRAITVSAQTDSKLYDGTTLSTAGPVIATGKLIKGDSASWSQSFDSRNAGDRTLTAHGSVEDGNGGNNYLVTFVDAQGAIERRAITVTAQSDSKMYDGNVKSNVAPVLSEGALVGGDSATWSQSFNDAAAGIGKMLRASGAILDGNGGNNYLVTFADDISGSIFAPTDGGQDGGQDADTSDYPRLIAVVRDANLVDLRNQDPLYSAWRMDGTSAHGERAGRFLRAEGEQSAGGYSADAHSSRGIDGAATRSCFGTGNRGVRMPERPESFLKREDERSDKSCSFFE